MHHVYVIQSRATKDLYFGRTDDLKRRLEQHNHGHTASTRGGGPWEYVYIESYRAKKDATARERSLKQYGNSRTHLKKRLQYSIGSK